MPTFDEGHQRFTFDDQRWTVEKYDSHADYRNKIAKLSGTKAVDFVGLLDGVRGDLYWIEVKDFRGYRIQNKERLSEGELAIEVAQKVRDSIAGIIGAYHTSGSWETWEPFVRSLQSRDNRVRVILWLEQDNMPGPPGVRKNQAQVLGQALAQKLRWLTARVFVLGSATGGCPEGLVVTDLQGAGQP